MAMRPLFPTHHSLRTTHYSLLAPVSKLLRAAGVAEIGIVEQLRERPQLADHALLVHVALNRFEVLPVRVGEAILPRIAPKDVLLLLDRGAYPGERHHAGVLHPAIGHLL